MIGEELDIDGLEEVLEKYSCISKGRIRRDYSVDIESRIALILLLKELVSRVKSITMGCDKIKFMLYPDFDVVQGRSLFIGSLYYNLYMTKGNGVLIATLDIYGTLMLSKSPRGSIREDNSPTFECMSDLVESIKKNLDVL